MNHDPKEHFSEAQIEVITFIFHGEMNAMLLKTVGAYVVTVILAVMAIGAGWYRLGHVEDNVATVMKSLSEGPRFTQDEGDALNAKHDQDVADLQRQIDGTTARLERMENKIDLILNRI
jgi:hypothetical protein